MPYPTNRSLPPALAGLPEGAKSIFRGAFNSAKSQDMKDENAFRIAWGAVKKSYEKDADGVWRKKHD